MSPNAPDTEEVKKGPKPFDRYPGLRPFVREDRLVFFGRKKEIEHLYNGIQVSPVFILYSKSGLGKSSLVSAGLLPKFEKQHYTTGTVRFFNENEKEKSGVTAVEIIIGELNKCIPALSLPTENEEAALELISQLAAPQKVLLVFDQFEEFLYYPAEQRIKASKFLNALLHASPTLNIKMLFLIRLDRFFLMKEVATHIPGILSFTFELGPLTVDKAEEAIELPGLIASLESPGAEFRTLTFEYTPDALRTILLTLQNGNKEIESSQLQIVCQELEEIASKRRLIDAADFGGTAGIKEILNKFYDKQMFKLEKDPDLRLSKRDKQIIHELIEDEMVSAGKRVIQSETRVKDILSAVKPGGHVLNKIDKVDLLIDKLLGLRLIREDDSHLGKVYEISHDTLVPAILESRAEYLNMKKRRKYFLIAAILIFTGLGLAGGLANLARQKHNEELSQQKTYISQRYYQLIRRKRDSIDTINRLLLSNQNQIQRLNRVLEVQVKQYKRASDSILLINTQLGNIRDSLVNINNQNAGKINSLNLVLDTTRKSNTTLFITVDTLKQRVFALQHKDKSYTSPSIRPDLTSQLKQQERQVAAAKDMVYKPSWFKPGYFLQFENIKVLLVGLDRKSRKIYVRLSDLGTTPGAAEKHIQSKDFNLNEGQTLNFNYDGYAYSILFEKIAPGGSVFSTAAYIVFKKNKG